MLTYLSVIAVIGIFACLHVAYEVAREFIAIILDGLSSYSALQAQWNAHAAQEQARREKVAAISAEKVVSGEGKMATPHLEKNDMQHCFTGNDALDGRPVSFIRKRERNIKHNFSISRE
jgi:hypothetical protein